MSTFAEPLSHGPLTPVASDVHAVRGSFKMGPGMSIGRTMTVLDTGDGLAILNAIRLSDAEQAKLDALGKVKHLVKLSDSHSIDEPFYAERYAPRIWSLPGAALKRLRAGETLGPAGPVAGGVVLSYGEIRGWREAAYWIPLGGGTLVTCDAIQNCADQEGFSSFGGLMTSLMGFKGGVIVPGMWKRMQKVAGDGLRKAFSGILQQSFANLVTGHGPPVTIDAVDRVRAAVDRAAG